MHHLPIIIDYVTKSRGLSLKIPGLDKQIELRKREDVDEVVERKTRPEAKVSGINLVV